MWKRPQLGELWRNPDFLKLWAGETISFFGSKITFLALPLTAIMTLGATAGEMGILGALELAPFLLITVFAGVWIDQQRRRPILIIANLGRALVLGLVPLLAYLDMLTMNRLYVIGFAQGVLQVFFDLAYQSYLPSLVTQKQLVEGNSKLQLSASVAEVGGPGLAGVLIDLLTAPIALLFDALSFVASAVGLILIRRREPTPEPDEAESRWSLWRKIRKGFGVVLGNPFLRACAGEATTYNLCYMIISTVFVLYVTRELGISASILGVIFSTASIGALLGASATKWISERFGLGKTTVFSAAIACGAFLLVPLATSDSPLSVGLLIFAHILIGFGVVICNIQTVSLRQTVTPDRLLGRMNASYRFFIFGIGPLGALIGGGLGELIGLRATLAVGAIGMQAAWLWLVFSPVPQLRQLTDALSEPATDSEPASEAAAG